MPPIYADSFGGLTQARLGEDAQRNAAFRAAISGAMTGLNSMRQQQNYEQQMAYQKQRDLKAADLEYERMQSEHEKEAMTEEHLKNQDKINQSYLDLYKRQLEQGGTPAQMRDNEFATRYLFDAADRGELGSLDEAQKFAPSVSPGLQAMAVQRSLSVRPSIEGQHLAASRAASLLNAYDTLDKSIPPNTPDATTLANTAKGGFFTRDETAKNAADLLGKVQKRTMISPIATKLKSSPLVSFDADTETWVPNVPAPRWLQNPGGGGGGTASGTEKSPGVRIVPGGLINAYEGSGGRSTTTNQPAGANTPSVRDVNQAIGNKRSSWFYSRVNELISTGMSPVAAKQRATMEESALQ